MKRDSKHFPMYSVLLAQSLHYWSYLSVCYKRLQIVLVAFDVKLEFGLAAKMEHYGCVVDILQEAYNFIKKMPFEADAVVFVESLSWEMK
uniref:Uncharacterized protein n=1 Tax=Solanum tuberosum TaxID=4113 RepID=M1D4Y1_SOLTU